MTGTSVLRAIVRTGLREMLRLQESRLVKPGQRPSAPPTFMIGAPRSGTTVAFQLLASQIRTSYICNFATKFPDSPVAATRLVRTAIRNYQWHFTSDYGRTSERAGPSEASNLWKKWFGGGWVDDATVPWENKQEARATIAAIEKSLGAPFLNKAPDNSGRIRPLNSTFPNCLFLWIRRDPLMVAESILKARRVDPQHSTNLPPEQVWWGHRPKEYEQLKPKDYIDQICGQVYCTERNIIDDLEAVGCRRYLEVWYEDICANPARQCERIVRFLTGRGVAVLPTGTPLPEFRAARTRKVSEDEFDRLRSAIQDLYSRQPHPVLSQRPQ